MYVCVCVCVCACVCASESVEVRTCAYDGAGPKNHDLKNSEMAFRRCFGWPGEQLN